MRWRGQTGPMAEPVDIDDETQDDLDDAARALRSLDGTARALRVVAVIAAVLWAVSTLSVFWTFWNSSENDQFLSVYGSADTERVVRILGQVLPATYGWALVAVLAAGASMLATGQRLRFALTALDREA